MGSARDRSGERRSRRRQSRAFPGPARGRHVRVSSTRSWSGWSIGSSLDGTGPDTIAKLQAYLPTRKSSDRIRGIFVYDASGRWLATTEHLDFSKLNNSDREYFRRHRDSPEPGTLIGPPVKSRSGGQWIITASRRINDSDGGFAGVALLTIDVSYFVKFYERFEIGPNGSASLLTNSGIMLARSRDESSAFVGRDLSNAPLFKGWEGRPAAAVYYFKSPLDGVQRLSYYQRSSRYPLMVLASKSQDDVLASWRRAAAARMTFVLGLVLLIAVIGYYLVCQLLQRQRTAQALVAKEANFRLLAEQSSDMVTRIGLDNRLLYVSPPAHASPAGRPKSCWARRPSPAFTRTTWSESSRPSSR